MVWEGWGRHVFFSRCHPVVSQNHGSAASGNVRFGSISCSVATWTQIYWRRAPQLAGVDRKGEVEASFSKEQFRGGNVRNVMIAQERGSLEECNESAKRGGHNLFFGWELLRSRIGVCFRSPFVVSSFSFKQWRVGYFRFSLLLTFPIRENFFIQKNRECHQLGDFPFLLVPRANTGRKKAHQTYLDHDSWPFLKSSSLRR